MDASRTAASAILSIALCACSAGKSDTGTNTPAERAEPAEGAIVGHADATDVMGASNDSFATPGGASAAAAAPSEPPALTAAGPTDAAAAQQPAPAASAGGFIVNGLALDTQMRAALTQAYGAVPVGEYWYDPVSGLVGVVGGPSSGQILPGLPLGSLAANASGGGDGTLTGVFINGREIHPDEARLLVAMFGYVNPGRYWLGHNLAGGYEGGPAMFDLRASARSAGQGGEPGYNRRTLFGDLMSDGQCSGYFDPNSGSSVMTGNC
ncbi:MAG: hypothetical protein HXY23_06320 [Parvularculaceae bacterium]|nr:hypothetical protein [Parvularculaceae bacterium]